MYSYLEGKINGDRVLFFYDKVILFKVYFSFIFLTFRKVVAILSYIFIN